MSQQTPVSLLTPAGRIKLIEDGIYQNYLAYFRKAEDTRRRGLFRGRELSAGLRDAGNADGAPLARARVVPGELGL